MEDYGNDIVTVVDDDGKEQQFEVLDRIETDDNKRYIALTAVFDSPEDMLDDSGELIILRVIEENGETVLEPIQNDEEFDEIGEIFQERLSEMFDFSENEAEE